MARRTPMQNPAVFASLTFTVALPYTYDMDRYGYCRGDQDELQPSWHILCFLLTKHIECCYMFVRVSANTQTIENESATTVVLSQTTYGQ
jgi:hypothetical protein